VVGREASFEPHGVLDAEGCPQFGDDLGFRPSGIAVRIELHRLREEHGAFAVDVDRSPLVHER
jgi:hypothetical protein